MAGRPRASSRDTIADAACELFLEQGYAATTVDDIARRAGVARSSFFNYFATKADVVWAAWDERTDAAAAAIAEGADLGATLRGIGAGFAPDALVLAVAQSDAMGLGDELGRERAVRQAQLATTLAARLRRDGADVLAADVRAGALAAAAFAALWSWATDAPAAASLESRIDEALELVGAAHRGAVRQLRLVVAVDDWEGAVSFYRDAAGMPVEAEYEAEAGARVAILDAGRATLELSNRAQVAFIDRVETDGDAPSDALRVGLEVTDAGEATARLAAAGAVLQASARETPWRSRNARLRAPEGLQLTLFEELGPE